MVKTQPLLALGDVLENTNLTDTIWQLTLHAPTIAANALPGQFINIRVSRHYDPLLRRPFSLNRICKTKNTISLLYKVLGRGTAMLSMARLGEQIDILGPLGSVFALQGAGQKAIFVAGGMGIAPCYPLAEKLLADGVAVTCLYGTRFAEDLVEADSIRQLGVNVVTASEDGGGHYLGKVTDLLELTLRTQEFSVGYACGPHAMLSTVKKTCCRHKLPLQVSLESFMACGLGLCLGCTHPKGDGEDYWHICTDGPVLWAKEVQL